MAIIARWCAVLRRKKGPCPKSEWRWRKTDGELGTYPLESTPIYDIETTFLLTSHGWICGHSDPRRLRSSRISVQCAGFDHWVHRRRFQGLDSQWRSSL